jgi:hypothetical protein
VAARFPTLRNDDVDAAVHGSTRRLGRADRMKDDRISGLGARHERRRITPEE